ncbi:MAG: hypothetical protein EZS28_035022 [Streblomastix strix]|uniref:Uncharacterized protein n=1 Tax=Streblomastix strix TaxID=222440 RepID=A0A5J4UH89_9EUKA|nr:MAG: hypothetical protein EZS28_035022 [Streblomastix strix]
MSEPADEPLLSQSLHMAFGKSFHLNSPINASASCTAVLVTLALMTSKSLIHNPYKKAAVELYWLNISYLKLHLDFIAHRNLEVDGFILVMSLSLHYHSMGISPPSASFRLFDPSVIQGILSLFLFHLGLGLIFLGGQEVRQGDTAITNHYPVFKGDEDNYWLPPSLLISPLY